MLGPHLSLNVSQKMESRVEKFWNRFLKSLPEQTGIGFSYKFNEFGDNPELADELVGLVLEGKKTAGCCSLWEYEHEGESLPVIGEKNIVLDGRKQPVAIIEFTEVEIKKYEEVDAKFAHDEGEDDRTLESWRREHWKYFSRVLPKIGKEPKRDMLLVCERFKLIYKE